MLYLEHLDTVSLYEMQIYTGTVGTGIYINTLKG
jgi:hypothetical protein